MSELCVCYWPESIVSEDSFKALAVERMLRNDEEYKEYLKTSSHIMGDPVGYLKYFSVKKERDLPDTEKLCLVAGHY
ncbi:BAD_collapsed_G0025940.mRNA.1.CDS.1 [Saccharomyces cerevisiae]|nr:BAD_collapsed_G0025940.mRNA.1.CDS.1 [Saccharomyces cerevisiae]